MRLLSESRPLPRDRTNQIRFGSSSDGNRDAMGMIARSVRHNLAQSSAFFASMRDPKLAFILLSTIRLQRAP